MNIFLDRLKVCLEHLSIIDNIFSTIEHPNRSNYEKFKEKIIEINNSTDPIQFTDSLYVGGKRKTNTANTTYNRAMILADILEYIFFGRGYYYVTNDIERKKNFLEILLYTINLLMIIDSISVQPSLRKRLLEKLSLEIDNSVFFKNEDMKKIHNALLKFEGDIGWKDRKNKKIEDPDIIKILKNTNPRKGKNENKLDNYFDSLLPKTGGGLWNELIVFFI